MEKRFDLILSQFRLASAPVSCERYGCGHINETYLVVTQSGRRYILQKLSNRAFPDIAGLQENIAAVTEYLHQHTVNDEAIKKMHQDRMLYLTWMHEQEACRCLPGYTKEELES